MKTNWYLSQTTELQNKAGDSAGRTRRLSFLGRAHYSYDSRYMLTLNFRADGSSKFKEHTWGFFPSAAAAWRISSEDWMQDVDALSDLKPAQSLLQRLLEGAADGHDLADRLHLSLQL